MDQVRLGIIGLGAQGGTYSMMLLGQTMRPGMPPMPKPDGMVLGGICEIDPEKKKMVKEKMPGVPFFDSYQEMIDSGKVDAVVTTVPHYLHPEIAIYALEHGLHVMAEKPAGVYVKDVIRMNECAEKHPDKTFAIMFNQRTNKLYKKLRELIASKELGEIRRTNWIINSWWRPDSYYQQSAWRATWGGEGGGVLVNQAPHQLDLWQWICGMPDKIYSKIVMGAHRDIVVDNDVTVVASYPNGATGCFITCTHDPIGTDRLEIDLEGGKIVVDDSKTATVYRLRKSESEMNASMSMMDVAKLVRGGGSDGLYTTETFENTDGWGVQHSTVLENFAQNILNGTPLIAPGSDGVYGVELANAILLSTWLGKEVDVPVDRELYVAELNKRIREEGEYPERG